MAVTDHPLVGLGYALPMAPRDFVRLDGDAAGPASANVAEEVPIALVYNGRPYVVVMGTPDDLEDLAVGFSVTEGIVDDACEIARVEAVRANHGIEMQIEIPTAAAERLESRTRAMASRTGCGLCGVERIEDAMRVPREVGRAFSITHAALWRAGEELSRQQIYNNATSTVHAAGWAHADGSMALVREDVGRHNALDKVLGAVSRSRRAPRAGMIVITSRASYEMIQKAATCGVELVAAISRPTNLAIRFADAAGVTLVALLRGTTANVYTHPHRIHPLSVEV